MNTDQVQGQNLSEIAEQDRGCRCFL